MVTMGGPDGSLGVHDSLAGSAYNPQKVSEQ